MAQASCTGEAVAPNAIRIARAESIIDGFYSWDEELLSSSLGSAEEADSVLYYQKWAEAAHYEVQQRRPCIQAEVSEVLCAITVTDDFGTTLGYTATDTFTFTFDSDSEVPTHVAFEGDDPLIFKALFVWMWMDRGEVFKGECKDMFAGGTTPSQCARAVARAARDFVAWMPLG